MQGRAPGLSEPILSRHVQGALHPQAGQSSRQHHEKGLAVPLRLPAESSSNKAIYSFYQFPSLCLALPWAGGILTLKNLRKIDNRHLNKNYSILGSGQDRADNNGVR